MLQRNATRVHPNSMRIDRKLSETGENLSENVQISCSIFRGRGDTRVQYFVAGATLVLYISWQARHLCSIFSGRGDTRVQYFVAGVALVFNIPWQGRHSCSIFRGRGDTRVRYFVAGASLVFDISWQGRHSCSIFRGRGGTCVKKGRKNDQGRSRGPSGARPGGGKRSETLRDRL